MFSCLHPVTICKSKFYPILTYKSLLKKNRRITLQYLQCNIRQYITIPSLIKQYNIKNCIVISYNFLLYNFFEIYLGIISFNSFESFLYNHPPNTFPISLYLYWQYLWGISLCPFGANMYSQSPCPNLCPYYSLVPINTFPIHSKYIAQYYFQYIVNTIISLSSIVLS